MVGVVFIEHFSVRPLKNFPAFLGQQLNPHPIVAEFSKGLLNPTMSPWLLKCGNQPVTGAPQPLLTTPKWLKYPAREMSKKKTCV